MEFKTLFPPNHLLYWAIQDNIDVSYLITLPYHLHTLIDSLDAEIQQQQGLDSVFLDTLKKWQVFYYCFQLGQLLRVMVGVGLFSG